MASISGGISSTGVLDPPSPSLAPRAQSGFFFAAASSSSMVNSFFLTVLSWFRKLNSAAFFWSLANLFSYFDTFCNVELINLKIFFPAFKLHIIFLRFADIHSVKIVPADLHQVLFGGVIKILGLTTSLVNDFPPLGSP